ncbi:Sodium/potassium/calcium exchanger 1 [Hondaea fermentalgiana]|uniref:Sodium/potassium/calcium exchanger 1 n=1 Tax=Hondaea fermentalgiana TaxID=2315210 RepID=A0A2R5G219_9STRA|nr:Sodium/potassium/calcium exchanger 1 [Hondaea fermentalgiana]|eukprot:GBG25067.1 Sodium/potassium/calcium exchanger 1 [Hondaea fermentalgiana]
MRSFRKARSQTRRVFRKVFAGLTVVALLCGVLALWHETGSNTLEADVSLLELGRRHLASAGTECNNSETGTLGKVFLNLLFILYAFLALAIVCDTFFEPSLEQISDKLELSEDVAGATFMAAGSSAPELFTSIADTFGSQNSIGVGTIVGSALFNILIIVAMSAAVTPKPIKLDWRPVVRDVSWYVAAIGIFVLFIINDTGVCTYVDDENTIIIHNATCNELETDCSYSYTHTNGTDMFVSMADDTLTCDVGLVYSFEGAILVLTYCGYILFMVFNSSILGRCSKNEIKVHDISHSAQGNQQGGEQNPKANNGANDDDDDNNNNVNGGQNEGQGEGEGGDKGGGGDDDDDDGPWWEVPDSLSGKIYFFISFPLVALLHSTIPDCSNEDGRFHRWFISTFVMSIVWIGAACQLAVILASEIGCILGINAIIMGLILLAAGTSVPDMIASMIVAKQGHADMAIANAVGSNVFDILLGLGLPWAFAEVIRGNPVIVDRGNLKIDIVVLVITVILYISTLILNRWTMEKRIGVVFVFIYFGYIIYAILVEAKEA